MSKTKSLQQRIVGKTKQAVGEIIADQELHEDGKAQGNSGKDEQERRSEFNPSKKLNQLTRA